MRKWIPLALIALAILWFLLTNIGSSMALADFAARPILAVERDGNRVPIKQPSDTRDPVQAWLHHAEGIQFGYRFHFTLPDGAIVTCSHRFRSLNCEDGWHAIRGGATLN